MVTVTFRPLSCTCDLFSDLLFLLSAVTSLPFAIVLLRHCYGITMTLLWHSYGIAMKCVSLIPPDSSM
jgi:hypothetical protein